MSRTDSGLETIILELLAVKTGAMTAREIAGLIYSDGPGEDGKWRVTATKLAKVRRVLRNLRDRELVYPLYNTRRGHRWADRAAAEEYAVNLVKAHGPVAVASDPALRRLVNAQRAAA